MKPKNNKERNSSFLKFLLLFLVTTGTVVGAVYFNYKVPSKENELLREQAKIMDEEMSYQSSFYEEMIATKLMIDSLDAPGANIKYLNSLISDKLVVLQKSIPTKDSTHLFDLHNSIVETYVELQETKDKLLELRDAESTIAEYEKALENCRADLKSTERELYIERRSN